MFVIKLTAERTSLSLKDLMEVDLSLSGANRSRIRILGGVVVTITGEDCSSKKWSTKQLCYIAKAVTRLMLSKKACVQLRIINSSFPSVGSLFPLMRMDPVPKALPDFEPRHLVQQDGCEPKHNGEPRQTVEIQALNKASVRQTHYTKSLFMLASEVPPNLT